MTLHEQLHWARVSLAHLMDQFRQQGRSGTYYDALADSIAGARQAVYDLEQKVAAR